MTPKKIVVLGGGISGLAFVNRLRELKSSDGPPFTVTLIDAAPRIGGIIETHRQEGFLLEGGPESFITDKPWAASLCERLGISRELIPTNPHGRRSFIYRAGRLREVPEGFYLIGPARVWPFLRSDLMSWPAKLRACLEPFVPRKKQEGDESAGAFIRRRFGEGALREAGQAMIGGIYSADPDTLSLQATFPKFLEMERAFGSVVKGLRSQAAKKAAEEKASGPRYSLFSTLRGGMETLVSALKEKNSQADFMTGDAAVKIARREAGWSVTLASGREREADVLCVALRAPHAAGLLKELAPELAGELASIAYESSVTVNLAFDETAFPRDLRGFGFVVPASENSGLLGCTFSHLKFEGRAPGSQVLLRAFLGGETRLKALTAPDKEAETMALAELKKIIPLQAAPLFSLVRRYPDSMPQYHVGHFDKAAHILRLAGTLPGLYLTGNAYAGVGIPDCIHLAEEQAARALEFLK